MSERLEIPEGFTPGPWVVGPGLDVMESQFFASICMVLDRKSDKANARLIALAPEMATEIERLRAENERLSEAVRGLLACPGIADANVEAAWACRETSEAEAYARSVLKAAEVEE